MMSAPAPPSLMGVAAYTIAWMSAAKVPESAWSAFTPMMVASGAMPMVPIPLCSAAMIPATCVAWENPNTLPRGGRVDGLERPLDGEEALVVSDCGGPDAAARTRVAERDAAIARADPADERIPRDGAHARDPRRACREVRRPRGREGDADLG